MSTARSSFCAGGAIGSPHILMLSGIGPANHLKEVGISVMHELPGVGQNLRDHPQVPVTLRVKEARFCPMAQSPGYRLGFATRRGVPTCAMICLSCRAPLPPRRGIRSHLTPSLWDFTSGPVSTLLLARAKSSSPLPTRTDNPPWTTTTWRSPLTASDCARACA